MIRRLGALTILGLLAGVAWADMSVREADNGPEIGVIAPRMAAFQPAPNELWVVAPSGKIMDYVFARSGWRVEPLQVQGGIGLKITSPQPRGWTLEKLPAGWLVKIGAMTPQGRQASAVVVKEGLAGGVPVQDRAGHRYWVQPVAEGAMRAGVMPGLVATLQGVALAQDFTLARAGKTTPAVTAPVVAAVKPVTPAAPVAEAAPVATVKLSSTFPKGPSLPRVATPVGQMAAEVEDIAPAAGPVHGTEAPAPAPTLMEGVYVPGTVVSFTMPPGYKLERGQLRREDSSLEIEKRLQFARTMGALDAASQKAGHVASQVGDVLDKPVQPPVAEVPLISSAAVIAKEMQTQHEAAVSATQDEVDFDKELAKDDTTPASELFPAIGPAREYWTGLTVRLVKLTRAMEKAGVKAEVAAAAAPEAATAPEAVEPHEGEDASPKLWETPPSAVRGNAAVVAARRELARYLIAWGRPHEAAQYLLELPLRDDGLPQVAEDRFLYGVALVAQGRGKQALPVLQADASTLPQHRALWKAVALQQVGRDAEALKAWPGEQGGVLLGYPARLRTQALMSHGEALIAVGDKADLKAFADSLAGEYPAGAVPARVVLMQGLARLQTREEQRGMELLAEAAETKDDMESAYRAKFAFVEALLRRGELEDRQVAAYLEDLRMFWRGDKLEQQVLVQLGDTYLHQRNYRKALGRWQTLIKAYPDYPGMAALTDKMTAAVVGVFDPENPEPLDALTYLGLYFDFKELLPNDNRGDRAMERAGRLLSTQGLPERAIPVLEQVLQFRAQEPIDKARVALFLADAYTRNGKPDLALRTLDQYRNFAVNTVQIKAWPVAEAKALLALNRPQQALESLQGSTEEEAPWLRSDAAWDMQQWDYLAEVLKPIVRRIEPASLPNNRANQVAVLRLAYALGQMQNRGELETLLDRFGSEAAHVPAMADSMAAIATQAGVAKVDEAARPLSQVAEALAGLNAYTDQFRARQKQVQERIDEREDYNNKMRYNELLPPPAGF